MAKRKKKGGKNVYVYERATGRIVERNEGLDARGVRNAEFYYGCQMNFADYSYVVRPYKIKGNKIRVAA